MTPPPGLQRCPNAPDVPRAGANRALVWDAASRASKPGPSRPSQTKRFHCLSARNTWKHRGLHAVGDGGNPVRGPGRMPRPSLGKPPKGFEPLTSPLPRECSTAELRWRRNANWHDKDGQPEPNRATGRGTRVREPRFVGICRGPVEDGFRVIEPRGGASARGTRSQWGQDGRRTALGGQR